MIEEKTLKIHSELQEEEEKTLKIYSELQEEYVEKFDDLPFCGICSNIEDRIPVIKEALKTGRTTMEILGIKDNGKVLF